MENLMNSSHKASTDAYREGWDRIFGKMSDASDKAITKEMSDKYVDEYGAECPFCGETQMNYSGLLSESGAVWVDVRCLGCGEEWQEIYECVAIERSPDWWANTPRNTTS